MPSKKSYTGYVYLIGSSRYGWYKIGKSYIPEIRVQDLGIMLPFRVDLYALWGTRDHSKLESSFHREYARNRINGEWFTFGEDVLREIITSYPPYFADRLFPLNEIDTMKSIDSSVQQDFDLFRLRASKIWGPKDKKSEALTVEMKEDRKYGREYYSVLTGAIEEAIHRNPTLEKKATKRFLLKCVNGLWNKPLDFFVKALENGIEQLSGSVVRSTEPGLNGG